MAITELEFPTSGTPTVPTDYAYQNEYIESNAKGYNAISLTNWDDSTTAPQVAEGSAIEINGAVWQVDADTSIATTDASSGVNYLVFDDDAGAFGWNDTAPTWSATLNGWYVSGDRATGHICTWDGSTSFTYKSMLVHGNLERNLIANNFGLNVSEFDTTTQQETTDGTTNTVLPKGIHYIRAVIVGDGVGTVTAAVKVEAYYSAAWNEIYELSKSTGDVFSLQNNFMVISDGVNYRLVTTLTEVGGGNGTVSAVWHWLK